MPRPGLSIWLRTLYGRNHLFEPESPDRKSGMIGRTTPTGQNGPAGTFIITYEFEPQTSGFPKLYQRLSYKTSALTRLSYGPKKLKKGTFRQYIKVSMNATAGIRTRVTSVAGTYHTTKLLSHKNDIIDFIGCERSEREGLFCKAKNVALCVSNARNHLVVMGPPGLSKHLRA